mgnify:CR=1 FL=1
MPNIRWKYRVFTNDRVECTSQTIIERECNCFSRYIGQLPENSMQSQRFNCLARAKLFFNEECKRCDENFCFSENARYYVVVLVEYGFGTWPSSPLGMSCPHRAANNFRLERVRPMSNVAGDV